VWKLRLTPQIGFRTDWEPPRFCPMAPHASGAHSYAAGKASTTTVAPLHGHDLSEGAGSKLSGIRCPFLGVERRQAGQ
jgi:hypothetical protein